MDVEISSEQRAALEDRRDGVVDTRTFPASMNALREVRSFVLQRAAEASLPKHVAHDLTIAASEASANAALYSDSPEIEVLLKVTAGRAEVRVADSGVFRCSLVMNEDGSPVRGRGLAVMMAVMDEVTIRRGTPEEPGTLVRLVKHLD